MIDNDDDDDRYTKTHMLQTPQHSVGSFEEYMQ